MEMHIIETARAVRDAILGMHDRVERSTAVTGSAEHPCWIVPGAGWQATVTNLWDLHGADCRVRRREPNERANVIHHELLEVHRGDEVVLSFLYEHGGKFEEVYDFVEDGWERAIIGAGLEELRRAA